ncbi:unnamed protein product [Rhizophagus irregularis]|nr:unnamed protein product [Rhizophagus irregularis]
MRHLTEKSYEIWNWNWAQLLRRMSTRKTNAQMICSYKECWASQSTCRDSIYSKICRFACRPIGYWRKELENPRTEYKTQKTIALLILEVDRHAKKSSVEFIKIRNYTRSRKRNGAI